MRVEGVDGVEEYVYDSDDQRVIKRVTRDGESHITRYVDQYAEERDGQLIRYAFLEDHRIARLDPLPSSATAPAPDDTWSWMVIVFGFGGWLLLSLLLARRLRVPRAIARLPAVATAVVCLIGALGLVSCRGDGTDPRDGSEPITELPGTAVFYIDDLQGAPLVAVDVDGEVTSESGYEAFGQRFGSGTPVGASWATRWTRPGWATSTPATTATTSAGF